MNVSLNFTTFFDDSATFSKKSDELLKKYQKDKDNIGTFLFAGANIKTQEKFLLAVNIDKFPKKVRIIIDNVEIGTRNVSPKEIIFEKISD